MAEKKDYGLSELDWIQIKSDIHVETFKEKVNRKLRENPLIPLGCLLTTGALTYGLWSFRKGDRAMSQKMMRLRVFGQGFTFIALVTGVMYSLADPGKTQNEKK